MERAIGFLLKSQANLEARIEQVNENLGARIDELGGRIEEVNQNLGARIEETNNLLGEYMRMQTTLVQVVTRTFVAQDEWNRRTDEKLNALIDTVNRMLGGGQGGTP